MNVIENMPFRLPNAPTTFQWLMETCLRDLNLNRCIIYLDDIIIFSKDLNLKWFIIYLDDIIIFSKDLASHLARLKAVFQKLEQVGLKLKPSKCELF